MVGDDPESELKAAQELGIEAVLLDSLGMFNRVDELPRITDFNQLERHLAWNKISSRLTKRWISFPKFRSVLNAVG